MSRYELYLLVHVGAATIWIGAAFAMAILETRAILAGSAERVVALAHEGAFLGPSLYLPANLLVLVSGVLLVGDASWGYDTLWIQLGLGGFAISFVIGAAFFGRGWATVGRLVEEEGVDSRRVHAQIRRMVVGSWLDLGVLLAVLVVMVAKPSAGETAVLVIVATLPFVCAAAAFALLRARSRQLQPEGVMGATSGS